MKLIRTVDEADPAQWCIVRTAPRSTVQLAKTLAEDGFEVWTPIQVLTQRAPRSKERVERKVPIMPSFIFGRSDRLSDLIGMAKRPMKRHLDFSVFRYMDRIPLLADDALEPLRSAEARALPRKQLRAYAAGETVRVPEGAFTGMSGIVEGADGRFTLVCFGGRIRVKIATFLLRSNDVTSSQPHMGTAAQAA